MAFKFEKLEIWHLAIDISDEIDKLTKTFPKDEIFVLTSQIKRAADSISLNISEGSTGQSDAEQRRFLGSAQRSAIEVVNCLYLAKRRGYLQNDDFIRLYNILEKEVMKIQAFKNSLK
ncbi:MAG: four helix bundle protein [Segetibacter sp.]